MTNHHHAPQACGRRARAHAFAHAGMRVFRAPALRIFPLPPADCGEMYGHAHNARTGERHSASKLHKAQA